MRRKKPVRLIRRLLSWIIVLSVSAAVLLVAWVATGPRSLERFTPAIERALAAEGAGFTVKIGATWLVWDGWAHPIDIRLRETKVFTPQGDVFSEFPEISLGLDVPSLLTGRLLPRAITINKPVISLLKQEDGSILFGFRQKEKDEQGESVPFSAAIAPLLAEEATGITRKLRYFRIRNADVSIGSAAEGVLFEANDADLMLRRSRRGKLQFAANANLRYGEVQSAVKTQFLLEKDKPTADGSIEFQGIMPSALAGLAENHPALSIMNLPLSGTATVSVDRQGALARLQFAVEGGQGEIVSEHLMAPLPVEWANIAGQVSNDGKDIQIDSFSAGIDGSTIGGEGVILLTADDAAIRATLKAKAIPAEKVAMFWPPELSPMTREWVTTNITAGIVPEAEAHINIELGDLKKPLLPKEAIDATIALSGATLRYLEGHPSLTAIDGGIHIDGVSLDGAISAASFMSDSKLTAGRVLIEDLNADNPYIKVSFTADSPAADIVRFLGLPRLEHAARLNLKKESAAGRAAGKAEVGFYFFSEEGKDDIAFSVKADAVDLGVKDFMNKFDISKANGAFAIDNDEVAFTGRGEVNGARIGEATVRYAFTPEDGFDTFLDLKDVTAPMEALPRFGYAAPDFVKGTLGVSGKVKIGDSRERSELSIDLAAAAIDNETIAWTKPEGVPATLSLVAEKQDGAMALSSLRLKGENIDIKGAGALNAGMTDIARLDLSPVAFGETALKRVLYENTPAGYVLEAEGERLDLGPWMARQEQKEESGFSFEHFPALKLKADIGSVTMGEGKALADFKGALDCSAICASADLKGMAGEKPFSFRILKNPKGKRQLSLRAENAGAFLAAIGLYGGMKDGAMTVIGNYTEGEYRMLKGRIDIHDYTLIDAPILGRILSLASLTGFFDTLQGKGIRFERLRAPFILQSDVFAFKNVKTHGPAIGLTMDGTVTLPETRFDLQGTVVPSYTLNSVVGKVPIVGQMLTGGEGQGVFAARYRVTGTEDDPQVAVNPLSILTPGFLRGLFDIFDTPEEEDG